MLLDEDLRFSTLMVDTLSTMRVERNDLEWPISVGCPSLVHGWAAVARGEPEVLHPHGGHPLHHPPHLHRAIRSQVCGWVCGRGVAIESLSQCFGSGFIESGSVSGSSILGSIPIRIQGFDDQKLKEIHRWKKLDIFKSKIAIYLSWMHWPDWTRIQFRIRIQVRNTGLSGIGIKLGWVRNYPYRLIMQCCGIRIKCGTVGTSRIPMLPFDILNCKSFCIMLYAFQKILIFSGLWPDPISYQALRLLFQVLIQNRIRS